MVKFSDAIKIISFDHNKHAPNPLNCFCSKVKDGGGLYDHHLHRYRLQRILGVICQGLIGPPSGARKLIFTFLEFLLSVGVYVFSENVFLFKTTKCRRLKLQTHISEIVVHFSKISILFLVFSTKLGIFKLY